jgi:two-component system LytT family response regulator
MSIRIVVADSDPQSREWVRENLPLDEGFEVVAECETEREIADALEQLKPDLFIVDPEMLGFDNLLALRKLEAAPPPAVIFFADTDRYGVAAFEVRAIDYLLKPVSPDRFIEALDRGRASLQSVNPKDAEGDLIALLREVRRYPEWLLIKNQDRSLFVAVRDIDWIESRRNNVLLHLGKTTYLHHATTRGIEARLDPSRFLRIHRSTIVNIERIGELQPWFNGDYVVSLRDGTKLAMSNGYRQKLKLFRRGAA